MADRLMAEAQRRILAGDLAGAVGLLERLARIRRAPAERVNALITAARLHLMLDAPEKAAALLDRAEPLASRAGLLADTLRVRAEWADKAADHATRRDAWRAWYAEVDGAHAISALRRLAAIAKEQDDSAAMLPLLDEAITRAAASIDLNEACVDALLERVAVHLNLQAVDAAAADLGRVEALLSDEPTAFRARWMGLRALVAHARGDLDAAVRRCIEARALAVACRDVPSYLSATMVLVALHEQRAQLVDAYDTLIRARESLRDLLGEPGAGLVQPALSGFEQRLGDELAAVHAAWVARRGG